MNKTKIIVPRGIRYINEWEGFHLPQEPSIIDKQITGCGFTEFCLTSEENVILCSPRKMLLANKENTNKLVKIINEELKDNISDYDKEFIYERLSKLKGGIANISVGGNTKTEIKEKIMRFEDSIHAIDIANNGVLPGEGISLLKVSNSITCINSGDTIMKKALEKPFEIIIKNIGKDINIIKKKIIDNKYTKIYNYQTDSLEDISISNILDPIDVVITSIKNATSIAALLLTTNYLVINENNPINNIL